MCYDQRAFQCSLSTSSEKPIQRRHIMMWVIFVWCNISIPRSGTEINASPTSDKLPRGGRVARPSHRQRNICPTLVRWFLHWATSTPHGHREENPFYDVTWRHNADVSSMQCWKCRQNIFGFWRLKNIENEERWMSASWESFWGARWRWEFKKTALNGFVFTWTQLAKLR